MGLYERLHAPRCGLGHVNCTTHDPEFPPPDPAKAGICNGCREVRPKLWLAPHFGYYCESCLRRAIRVANWKPPSER